MSKDEKQGRYIAALIRERDGYLAGGLTWRAEEVEAELARIGAKAAPPVKRAAQRVTKGREKR